MDDAIENGVGERGISDDLVPGVDGELAGDDSRGGPSRFSRISSRSRRSAAVSTDKPKSSEIRSWARPMVLSRRA